MESAERRRSDHGVSSVRRGKAVPERVPDQLPPVAQPGLAEDVVDVVILQGSRPARRGAIGPAPRIDREKIPDDVRDPVGLTPLILAVAVTYRQVMGMTDPGRGARWDATLRN